METEELQKRVADLEQQNKQLAQSVSGLLLLACLILGLWNIYQALAIPKFGEIFEQMLGGKALPAVSTAVLNLQMPLTVLALALPMAAIAAFFTLGRRPSGLWPMLLIFLVIGVQLLITRNALWQPLVSIVSDMSSG